ncbi:MAG: LapA family protein [Alphaproteobacteria bacterium]|nr:LapA family protein [Alphaproteobacteria bacterium]
MRPLFWIVGVPLLLIGAFFAVANRELVAIDLWPATGKVTMPLFAALVGALYLGFLLGAIVAWWAGRHGRGRARETRRRLGDLQRENQQLHERADRLAAEAARAAQAAARAPAPALPQA